METRILGYIEGCSTILLMGIAMPLKYIGGNEILVKILGPIHGVLFSLYVLILFLGVSKKWKRDAFIIGFISAIFPGGPFWFEREMSKGRWNVDQA